MVYCTIEALLVLHNILEAQQDNPKSITHYPHDEPHHEKVLQEVFGPGNDR